MKSATPVILAINGGSSSIKFALFEMGRSLRRMLEGRVERIGLPEAGFMVKSVNPAESFSRAMAAPNPAMVKNMMRQVMCGDRVLVATPANLNAVFKRAVRVSHLSRAGDTLVA
jgi:acetate kinase